MCIFFCLSVFLSDFYQIYLPVILMTVLISGIWKLTVADPDLQIRGGGHLDSEVREGVVSKFFFWSKNKGGARAPPLDPLLIKSFCCHLISYNVKL